MARGVRSAFFTIFLAACLAGMSWPGVAAPPPPDYNREILPILAKNCYACHGPDEEHREGGLRLDSRPGALAKLDSGQQGIVPGQPDASEVLRRLTTADASERMPPAKTGITIKPEQIELLRRWIAAGAEFAPLWSFVPPQKSSLPAVRDGNWPRGDLDRFVLARLDAAGLAPNPEADRYTLIRRLSLDLRGLPPTPAEVEQFVKDKDPKAYEKLVDRFFADDAYGERWARMWLDLARYADSSGYGSDPLRTIWGYRDWVIRAFNRNLPYDQFTVEQLAGDLLPNATLDQKVATAFHRNTQTNTEGGTDDEEFRVVAVKDRVDTTMQVWMGLTMGCAKCHNHKYDPITTREYYEFYDFFNQSADADRGDESPLVNVPLPGDSIAKQKLEAQLADLRKQLETTTPELAAAQVAWEKSLAWPDAWLAAETLEATATGGATIRPDGSGAFLVEGPVAKQASYTLVLKARLPRLTAIRLETLPNPELPGGGAGRSATGDFTLTRVHATLGKAGESNQQVAGRFVRVELPGEGKFLHLAEVEVYSGGRNVARQGKATQSSTDYDGPPQLAIDGNTNGDYNAKSVSHTAGQANPWWEVDLGLVQPIEKIVVWNRTDGATAARLAGFRVLVLDDKRQTRFSESPGTVPDPKLDVAPSGKRTVNFVQATSDYAEPGKSAANLVAPNNQAGWAVDIKRTERHVLFLLAAESAPLAEDTSVTLVLEQNAGEGRLLGRFRLSLQGEEGLLARKGVPLDILAAIDLPAERRTPEQQARLAAYYRTIAPALAKVRDEIVKLEKSQPTGTTVPVMVELLPNQRRQSHVLQKGNFLSPGDKVSAATPAALHPFPADAPRNRLGLARWLVDRRNPTTARVAVNRFWAQLFGAGLVETEEDFGLQGDPPTHPELLDWLAVEFMDQGWDIKQLLKTIVLSATYRQSALVTPGKLALDPRNRLLSRGPRFRLEAEMVRDQALALAGLLSRKMYGPSVFPPQPPNLWQAAFNGQRTWATSAGEDKFRRGIYVFWRRTIPYPSMTTFDAPSRETCSIRRIRTNTPLQSLVTLNDPVYVEAAQALARRIMAEGGATPDDRIRFALQLCLVRPPSDEQVAALRGLYASELAHFQANPNDAKKLATDPLGPLPAGMSEADAAAWTVVANVLLNLDGVLTKG